MDNIVISLCDFSGNAVRPWAEAGYSCFIYDVVHPPGINLKEPNIYTVQSDVTKLEKLPEGNISFVFAWPPCTDLAISGARWFKEKGLDSLIEALKIFSACIKICEASDAPYMIENPVSTVSTYWRKPDYIVQPYEYAGYIENWQEESYSKKTCLWVGNGFILPEKKPVPNLMGSKMWKMPDSKGRQEKRSITPMGISRAIYEANSK